MSFVDEIYSMYRNQLTGDEEDAVVLVLNLLEEHSKSDILNKIHTMEDNEVIQMFAMYLIEMLKVKMAQEGVGGSDFNSDNSDSRFH